MTTTAQALTLAREWWTDPYSPAPRAVAVSARTAHLLTTSIYLGGKMFGAPESSLRTWRMLTTMSGSALLLTEMAHSRNWPHQGRGIMTMAHVGVLGLGHINPRLAKGAAVTALLLGSVGSHLPRTVRRWSVLTRSVLP